MGGIFWTGARRAWGVTAPSIRIAGAAPASFGSGFLGARRALAGLAVLGLAVVTGLPQSAAAQTYTPPLYGPSQGPSVNMMGSPGLIDMPTAEHAEPGRITSTLSFFPGPARTFRATLTFQISERFSGSFRYGSVDGYNLTGRPTRYDRSFDVRFLAVRESKYIPAITIGLQDFAGTGVYSGEYIVATKNIGDRLKVTLGAGWGRLAGDAGINQRNRNIGRGGVPDVGNWFRGPIRPFGGIEWQTPIRGLSLKAEYSSDRYTIETQRAGFERSSRFNFGLEYNRRGNVNWGLYYLQGNYLAFRVALSFNPRRAPAPSGLENAPPPVFGRPALRPGQRYDTAWVASPGVVPALQKNLDAQLEPTQLTAQGLQVSGTTATVYLRNTRYQAQAQAVGRMARAMSRSLPASVETFRIVTTARDVPVAVITIQRRDLESLEYDAAGAEKLLERAQITDAAPRPPEGFVYKDGQFPRFRWSITPALRQSFFDPDNPVRLELGVRASAEYNFAPGLSVYGSILQPLVGTLDEITRGANPSRNVPRVRSFVAEYYREGNPSLERLTVDYLFKVRSDIYGRVSAGLLERMYGGVSAEILWKPANSRLALGAEVNYARQRAFNQRFSFRDYDVLTGHLSAYYDFDNGFQAQIDAGRYLAGDWGATFTVNRRFRNGWQVGAFFTLTDIPFEDFGEGSFDKGILLTIPLGWGIGTPSQQNYSTALRPLTRDGGARLSIRNRLYETVREADGRAVSRTWGRVWR